MQLAWGPSEQLLTPQSRSHIPPLCGLGSCRTPRAHVLIPRSSLSSPLLLPEALLGDARIAGHGECWLTKSTLGFSSGEPSSRGNGSGDELGKTAERDVSHTFLLQIQQVIDDAEVGGGG